MVAQEAVDGAVAEDLVQSLRDQRLLLVVVRRAPLGGEQFLRQPDEFRPNVPFTQPLAPLLGEDRGQTLLEAQLDIGTLRAPGVVGVGCGAYEIVYGVNCLHW